MTRKQFLYLIKPFRDSRKINWTKIARQLGVHHRTIWRYRDGGGAKDNSAKANKLRADIIELAKEQAQQHIKDLQAIL